MNASAYVEIVYNSRACSIGLSWAVNIYLGPGHYWWQWEATTKLLHSSTTFNEVAGS